ncbi:MAG: ASKHA domain-containing protein [Desulfobacterales bacterium]
MAKLTIFPIEKSIYTRRKETVREALNRIGVDFETPCNGQGICGKCIVRVSPADDAPETPHPDISEQQAREGLRLACRLVPQKDLNVYLLSDDLGDDHRILTGARYRDDDVNARHGSHKRNFLHSKPVIGIKTHPAGRVAEKNGKFVFTYDGIHREIVMSWMEGTSEKGLAIDIGTTTLVVSLVTLKEFRKLSTASSLNPQIKYGHDVISRIQMGSTEEGLKALSDMIHEALNLLIEEVCENAGSHPQEIIDVVIGGNTTMLQIAAGIDPAPLGRVPFTVGIEGGRTYSAKRFRLNVNPVARAYVPPVAHAFIGADISAGLLVPKGFFESGRNMLFIDIGTNGEMGLSVDNRWFVTSTAAGPAFEGMGVSGGMRAQIGAVEAAKLKNTSITIQTIGNAPPIGICGSGIIDITAVLLKAGVIDASGRMRRPHEKDELLIGLSERLVEIDNKAAFRIGNDIYFTQEDVRQVQLAKSAISSGIDILLEEAGIEPDQLDRIIIAGGFGFSLNPDSLEAIGLIPSGTGPKVYFAGNTCLIGCVRLLRNIEYRRFIEKQMNRVSHLPIESRPDFMDRYVENMEFKATPPLASVA